MQLIIILILLFFIFFQTEDFIDLIQDDTDQRFCYLYGCSNIRAHDSNLLDFKKEIKEVAKNTDTPTTKPAEKIKEDYKYIGILENTYYNQKYMLYGKPFKSDYELEDKLFEYKLYSTIGTVLKEEYTLPPRNEILEGEYVWVAYGSLQFGPLFLKK
jgi:hypothetical protein